MITVAQEVSPSVTQVRKNRSKHVDVFRTCSRCLGSLLQDKSTISSRRYSLILFSFFFSPTRRPSRWDDPTRIAPLATPETLSEASTSSPPSPVVPAPRPMRRTPKIPGNLSTAADDLKNNLHYAMLSAKNYFLRTTGEHAGGSNNGSSSGNSEASYESAKSLAAAGLPPPVPRRRDSVTVRR
ncbi:sn1-specific diacylglycerol lipase alpha-like protein [Lasius niger]|uniref:Sn1-specific diacylglycerol lipase alpha-like protein n=1 Tax=Lasius niger TaxID=67767 RepID=A0A0J7L6M7_LASNI|nr:sn1-specific diacylglycerol lipase alpha-like protein [Lasius niger]